jgi:hypothetical protein
VRARSEAGSSALPAEVIAVQYLGSCLESRVSVLGTELRVSTEPALALTSGDEIALEVAPGDCILLPDQR